MQNALLQLARIHVAIACKQFRATSNSMLVCTGGAKQHTREESSCKQGRSSRCSHAQLRKHTCNTKPQHCTMHPGIGGINVLICPVTNLSLEMCGQTFFTVRTRPQLEGTDLAYLTSCMSRCLTQVRSKRVLRFCMVAERLVPLRSLSTPAHGGHSFGLPGTRYSSQPTDY